MRHEQPHARGFTLVELLVVVSIILLMVAIVVPGIRQATFNAKVVTCQAQMRNWGVSTIQYTADFNRYLPRQDINHDTSNNPWDISRDFFRVMIEGRETGVNSTGYGLPYYPQEWWPWWGAMRCGCIPPIWFGPRGNPVRELVMQGTEELSQSGRLELTIDTQAALRDHPNRDHQYVVEAEVTDASRRDGEEE